MIVDEEMLEVPELHMALPLVLLARPDTFQRTPADVRVVEPLNLGLVDALEVVPDVAIDAELALFNRKLSLLRLVNDIFRLFWRELEFFRRSLPILFCEWLWIFRRIAHVPNNTSICS